MPLKPWEIDRRTGAQGPTTQRRIPVRPPTQTQPYTSRPQPTPPTETISTSRLRSAQATSRTSSLTWRRCSDLAVAAVAAATAAAVAAVLGSASSVNGLAARSTS